MNTDELVVAYRGRLGGFALDAAFSLPASGVIGVFGPSGSGKSSLLRCMAGLQTVPGRLCIGDDVLQDDKRHLFQPAHRRRIGYVFQHANLFSHLSVRDNLLFGQRRLDPATAASAAPHSSLEDVTAFLGLGELLERRPDRLSGGERQRVAIGRALLSQPRLLLMDEPLAALDRDRKDEILPYLEALHASHAVPIVYVTHDMLELERLADHLVLMRDGRCVAAGPLSRLQADPKLWLVNRPEASIVLEGRIADIDREFALARLELSGGALHVPGSGLKAGDRCRVRIRASDVSLARTEPYDSTILNVFPARIVDTVAQDDAGSQLNVLLSIGADGGGDVLIARVTRKSWSRLHLQVGEHVYAQVKSVAVSARPQPTAAA